MEMYAGMKIFACNGNKELAKEIADALGMELGKATVKTFADGEVSILLEEEVRGMDVYVVQPTCRPVNQNLMELLVMIDALRRSSAARITAVIPYYGYARQDRPSRGREPISAKLVANLISWAGADSVVTMDLHASQIRGFFDIPVEHLVGVPVLSEYFKDMDPSELVVVSPDHGSVGRAHSMADPLDLPVAIIHKKRPAPNEVEVTDVIGDIKGKKCIMVDDMIDTAGTICAAANALQSLGAKEIYACATHPVLSGPAMDRINKSAITEMILLNTMPIAEEGKSPKIRTLSVAPVLAETIRKMHNNESLIED